MRKRDANASFVEEWKRSGVEGADLTTEYRFHPVRRWRFDVAFPSQRVAVEIDGFGFGHQSKAGRVADNEKQNAAVLLGWRVLRFTTDDVRPYKVKDTVETVNALLCGAEHVF